MALQLPLAPRNTPIVHAGFLFRKIGCVIAECEKEEVVIEGMKVGLGDR